MSILVLWAFVHYITNSLRQFLNILPFVIAGSDDGYRLLGFVVICHCFGRKWLRLLPKKFKKVLDAIRY